MSPGTLLLISDLHARYGVLNEQIRHAEAELDEAIDQVMVLGDFGFFADEMHEHFRRTGHCFLRPTACIEGNHEDHGAVIRLAADYADIVTHVPRGRTHQLANWRALCLGGARYMDAWSTPRGCEITEDEMQFSLGHAADSIDVVCTHDCPDNIGVAQKPGFEYYGPLGVPGMSRLAVRYRPRFWFFGHHHHWFEKDHEGTHYLGLPESWQGYALLDAKGGLTKVTHEVPLASRPWWKRWLGLG